MFGGVCGIVNGHMFSGLFARSVIAKLSEADQREALALDGSAPFDPMGNGRVMKDTILLAEEVMDDPQVLRGWLRRSFEYALTLPKKEPKAKAAKGAKPKPAAVEASPVKPAKAAEPAKAEPAKAAKITAKPAKAAKATAKPAKAAKTTTKSAKAAAKLTKAAKGPARSAKAKAPAAKRKR